MLGRFVVVQIKCSHTVFPTNTICMHEMMWRQMHKPTQILKAPWRMSFYCDTIFWYLHGCGSSLFSSFASVEQVHPCQLGALHLWDPCWLTQSTLGQMVHAAVMVIFQSSFCEMANWQHIILMWYWSWFITASISPNRVFTFLLFQIVVDGQ